MAVVSLAHPFDGAERATYDPAAIVAGSRARSVDAVARLASAGALGFSVAIPLVVLVAYSVPPYAGHFPIAFAATAVYLPLHVRHVSYALKGVRPPALPWTLLAVAVAIAVPVPLLAAHPGGLAWLYAFHALAASVLVTTRPRLSAPVLVAILAAVAVWGYHVDGFRGGVPLYEIAAVLDRAMVVFVPVWLVGALRRVRGVRVVLAEQSLEAERGRVDDEVRRTIGAQIDVVLAAAQRIQHGTRSGASSPEAELESLVFGSRRALTEARRLIGRYKLASARVELENAASLLRAAGMQVRVDAPGEMLPPPLDEAARAALRTTLAGLLASGSADPVVLELRWKGGSHEVAIVRGEVAA